ncbi:MAG: translation elongation factor Ts [Pseudomonadota bacterium]|nr:translation elongation factor Ts [Pseudomonadota bacterium]
MAITAAMVKALRERTGLGMMDCKKALTATDGDLEAAIEKLRKDGALKAAKKSGRTAAEGLLGHKVAEDGSCGVLVEVNIETDFAARNEKFIEWIDRVTDIAFEQKSDDVAALLAGGLEDERATLVQEIGENVSLRRIAILEGDNVGAYVHSDRRKAALVALEGGSVDLARDLAMHVVAIGPKVVSPEDLDQADVDKEREIFEAQAAESGKPPEIVTKMVEGRLNKYKAEVSLTEQPFVKDGDVKVKKLLADAAAKCAAFTRFEVGEGIEKEETDFAAEVAAQVKGEG